MATQIIPAFSVTEKPVPEAAHLFVAEFFCDTIQGENFMGWPATFLRLKKCTLNCQWCDTQEVWRQGAPFTFEELFNLMDQYDVPEKLFKGQHLVLTGGSPLLQQDTLVAFINEFFNTYDFKPYIEIENECTLMPSDKLIKIVDCWNNSPKLSNSGNPDKARYKPAVLQKLSALQNSWFKFVVTNETDWKEILHDFIKPGYIKMRQVVLMPEGATQDELNAHREYVIQLAIKNNVRYSDRLHVNFWNKKTGI